MESVAEIQPQNPPQPSLGVQEPVVVKLKSSFKYDQPSLPHLLTEYGFEDQEAVKRRKEHEEEKKRIRAQNKLRKKTESFDGNEDNTELERRREKEEHYEQLVRDMYRLRDYYYDEYSTLLTEKVTKQRRELRARDAKEKKEAEAREEEERKASHRVKKRLERHTLATTPETQSVPKTDLYYIVGLEDKLRREGKLKTMTDYSKFRSEIARPEVFYSNFKVNKHTDFTRHGDSLTDHQSVLSHVESSESEHPLPKDVNPHLRSLSRISESRETRIETDPWAVTQQYQSRYKSRKKSLPFSQNVNRMKRESQSDLERRFPKLEMPKLHCFTLNLAKKPPDPEEVLRESQLRTKEKQRKKMVRTVTKMYQLAMSNAAISNRIMDQHDDMDMLFNGPDLCDVIADHHWMDAYGLTGLDHLVPLEDQMLDEMGQPMLQREETPQALEYIRQATSEDEDETQHLPEIPQGTSSTASSKAESQMGSRKSSAKSRRSGSSPVEAPTPLAPLTMGEIQDKCNIKESKALSTLWTNYLRAGK